MSKDNAQKAQGVPAEDGPDVQALKNAVHERIVQGYSAMNQAGQNCFADLDLDEHRGSKFLRTFPPDYDWLIEGSLQQGQVGMVAAPGGIGKSFLLLQLGMAVASGTDCLNGVFPVSKTGPVLAVFAEDDEATIHRRIQAIAMHRLESVATDKLNFSSPTPYAAKAHLFDDLFIISGVGHDMRFFKKNKENLTPTQVYNSFLAACKAIEGLSLVILDPLSRFYTENENDNQAATYFASLLERIAIETGVTVISIHHTAKLNKSDESVDKYLQQDAARGASGFTNAVRWQLNIAPLSRKEVKDIGGDPLRVGHYLAAKVVKKNAGPPESRFYLERGPGGVLTRFTPIEKDTSEVQERILSILHEREQGHERITLNGFLKAYGTKKNFDMGRERLSPILDSMIKAGEIVSISEKNGSGQLTEYIYTKEVAETMKAADQLEQPG